VRVNKRLDIQGLRALAVVAVLGFHGTEVLPGGFLGVDVFFVISGYIIVLTALREQRRTGRFDARAFMARRVWRLAPAMAVVLAAATLAAVLLESPLDLVGDVARTSAASLLGLANVSFYAGSVDYFRSFELNPLLNMWSLAVEVQFYLAFALVTWAALRWARPHVRRVALGLLAAVTVGSFASALLLALAPEVLPLRDAASFSFFFPFTRLWQFGAGALVALLPASGRRWAGRGQALDAASVAAVVAIVTSFAVLDDRGVVPGYVAVAPTLATAALLWIGGCRTGPVQRRLAHPAALYLGDRSYSIYLWQGPLIVYAAMLYSTATAIAVAAVGSVLLGGLTYRSVEQRYRGRGGTHRSWRAGEPAVRRGRPTAALTGFLALVGGFALVGTVLEPAIADLHAEPPVRATLLDPDCPRQRGDGRFEPCRYGGDDQPAAMLIGDSHAAALSEAFVVAAEAVGRPAVIATGSACSPYDLPEVVSYRPSCEGYGDQVLRYVEEEGVETVVLHQFSEFYVHELGIGLPRWGEATAAYVERLRERGASVVILGDTPRARSAVARPTWTAAWSVDLSASLAVREEIGRVESAALEQLPGASYHPAAGVFCEAERCPVFGPEGWRFTDGDHLSVVGAALLEEHLAELLLEGRGAAP
jgi:peptidoglycan/LPS O-acetylase OafA/YrhL